MLNFQVDEIPMNEVEGVEDARLSAMQRDGHAHHKGAHTLDEVEDEQLFLNAVVIRTKAGGFNSGRAYYLKAPDADVCGKLMMDLPRLCSAAKKRAASASSLMRLQGKVRKVYDTKFFQGVMIVCILLVSSSRALPSL